MSAVSIQTSLPHYEEALAYWEDLTQQCRRHVAAINEVVAESQLPENLRIKWMSSPRNFVMLREELPSTEVRLRLEFEHWGPKVSVSVRGDEATGLRYYPEDFEFAIASDTDDKTVAMITEGRSLSAHEFAKYVSQNFRRCFPTLSLPCPDCPF